MCTHIPVTEEKHGFWWGAGWFGLSSSEVWFSEWVGGFLGVLFGFFLLVSFCGKVCEGV